MQWSRSQGSVSGAPGALEAASSKIYRITADPFHLVRTYQCASKDLFFDVCSFFLSQEKPEAKENAP